MKRYKDYSLLAHNTFGIAARCKEFVEYETVEELNEVLSQLRLTPGRRFLHIGSGSNLLFTKDYDGVILHSGILGSEVTDEDDDTVWVRVGAGENWDEFVGHCVAAGHYGLENLSLIPGEVGASAVQNIGAYGSEAGRFIHSVETVEVESGKRCIFGHDECQYAYRNSIFKGENHGRYVVTHVTYRLSRHFTPDLSYAGLRRELENLGLSSATLSAGQLRDIVINVRRAKLPDPAYTGSAGSFFMNPVVPAAKHIELQREYPTMPAYPLPDGNVKIPAGWLIEQCGWKGKAMGRAGVYDRQALVLVNLGGATGGEIAALSDAVRRDVRDKFGIEIHPEVNFF